MRILIRPLNKRIIKNGSLHNSFYEGSVITRSMARRYAAYGNMISGFKKNTRKQVSETENNK